MISLRPYQEKLLADIDEAHKSGARNVLAVSPTGSGKTVSFSALTQRQSLPVCLLVHRTELVSQISMTLARFEIRHGIIAPSAVVRSIRSEQFREFDRHFDNPQSRVRVASVDTLMSRADMYKDYLRQVRLWIGDEAAHMLAVNKWGVCTNLMPNALGVGFTATPKRADGKGLGRVCGDGIFDDMILGPTVADLIESGHLSNYRIIAKKSDMAIDDLAATASGDYSPEKLRTRSHASHIVGDVVDNYVKYASGKQGITFTVDVETANELAEQFRQRGIPAASVSAKTPEAERQASVRAFREGRIKQLTNCDLFGEGFDVPGVEVVSLARPTMSLSLHLQQVGRALRPSPGKPHALILDHVGNWERHGLPDTPRVWSLDPPRISRSKLPDPDALHLTSCFECFEPFERKLLPTCPHCGAVREPGERKKPEQVDGDLEELDPKILHALRQAVKLASPQEVADKVTFKAGKAAGKAAFSNQQNRIKEQNRLQDAIAIWAGVRKDRGQSDKASFREFFLAFGTDVLTAQMLPRDEMETLRLRIEKHV